MKKVVGLLLCFAMIFFAGLTFVACTNPDEGTGEKYTITINLKTEGGTLTSSHNSATAGTEVTFTANPQTGYKINYITVYYKSNGYYQSYYDMGLTNNKQTVKMPASDIVVDVYFAQDLHDIDIRQTYNGQINCRKEQAMEGEHITVSFVPNEGYELNSATVFGGGLDIKVEAGSGSVSFEMPDSDVSIYATFKPKTYDVSVIGSTENGTIEAPETKTYKSTVTLNIKPNEGYEIENIVVMNGSVSVPVTIDGKTATFKMPAGNVTISATFKKASYDITTEETVNGAFQVDKETANFGDEVTITFYPEPGYEVSYVNVETISGTIKTIEVTGEGNTRTFIMPAGSVRISASFEIGNYSVIVNASENGNVQASHSTAQYGDPITLTVNPNEYYKLSNISIICNGEEVARQVSGSTITFTMPAGNVTISATFAQNGNSITISDLTNGNLIVNPIIAQEGESVQITIQPDAGYELETITVMFGDVPVELTGEGNTRTFTMPAGDVTVSATFSKISYTISKKPTENGSFEVVENATFGDSITITINPNEGYEIDTITVMNGIKKVTVSGEGNTRTFTMPAGNVTVSVSFKIIEYTVTTTPGEGGTITPSNPVVEYNQSQTVTVTPNAGYYIVSITVNGEPVEVTALQGQSQEVVLNNVVSNQTVSATFEKISYSISKNPTENGSFEISEETATFGETITITITPNEGYQVNIITVKKDSQTISVYGSGNTRTFTMPIGNVTISVTFSKIPYTISKNPTENGSLNVVTSGTINDEITITINPNEGYEVDTVTVMNGIEEIIVSGEGNTRTFTMPAGNVTISATFSKISYTISKNPTENGSFEINKETATIGDEITITINPNEGYEVGTVTVMNGSKKVTVSGEGNTRTFIMPAGNVTVSVTFSKIPYTISKNPTENGSLNVATSGTIGDKITVTINPNEGYELNTITVMNGNEEVTVSGEGNTRTFTMPVGNVTISATFSKISYTISKISTENGSFEVVDNATFGETITITITPSEGYQVNIVTVKKGSQTVSISGSGNTRTFIMPAGNVTVSVEFKLADFIINEEGQVEYVGSQDVTEIVIPETVFETTVSAIPKNLPQSIKILTIPATILSISESELATLTNLEKITLLGNLSSPYTLPITSDKYICEWNYNGNSVSTMQSSGTYEFSIIGYAEIPSVSDGWGYEIINSKYGIYKVPAGSGTLIIPNQLKLDTGDIVDICFVQGRLTYNTSMENIDGYSKVIISKGIKAINSAAFKQCTNLTEIVIPDGVTSIVGSAFSYCSSLTEIVIPDSVTSIGNSTFRECTSLTFNEYGNALYLGTETNPYHFLIEAVSTDITSATIHSDCKVIADNSFNWCDSLTEIVIPDSVIRIGNTAFSGCTSLTEIVISDSVTSIGYNAFSGCTSLASVTLGNSVTSIGNFAFSGCTSLTEIVIPESVTSIENGVFFNCTSLTFNEYGNALYLGNETNPYHALIKAVSTDITSATIHSDCKVIAENAFSGCTSLTEIVIPDSVTSINKYAFSNCSSLTEIVIPDSVTSIENGVFNNCTSLTEITINGDIIYVALRDANIFAFVKCYNLTTLNIGANVTSLPEDLFISGNLEYITTINIDPANDSFTLELSEDGSTYDLKDINGNILKSGITGGSNITAGSDAVIE